MEFYSVIQNVNDIKLQPHRDRTRLVLKRNPKAYSVNVDFEDYRII